MVDGQFDAPVAYRVFDVDRPILLDKVGGGRIHDLPVAAEDEGRVGQRELDLKSLPPIVNQQGGARVGAMQGELAVKLQVPDFMEGPGNALIERVIVQNG